MGDRRLSSPSFSESSFGSVSGVDTDLELFPELHGPTLSELVTNPNNNGVTKIQNGIEVSNKGDPYGQVIAIRLDSSKENDLIDYLTGETDQNCSESLRTKLSQLAGDQGSRTSSVNSSHPYFNSVGKCMSKNAVAARENRLRKKNYVTDLEQSVKSLTGQNTTLKSQVRTMECNISELQEEVKYLRSVLANQSTLSALLSNIPSVPGISLASSETQFMPQGNLDVAESVEEIVVYEETNTVDVTHQTSALVPESVDNNCNFGINVHLPQGCGEKKMTKNDHSYATANVSHVMFSKGRPREKEKIGGGICLHVSGKKVSLEMCALCSQKASSVKEAV